MELATLFSQEGAQALRSALNDDPQWLREAGGWTTTLGLVVEGGAPAQALRLQLENGLCQEIRPTGESELEGAEFVLKGTEPVWRGVLSGQLDAVGAVLMGKLKVIRGNVMALASRAGAARLLLEKAKAVVERRA